MMGLVLDGLHPARQRQFVTSWRSIVAWAHDTSVRLESSGAFVQMLSGVLVQAAQGDLTAVKQALAAQQMEAAGLQQQLDQAVELYTSIQGVLPSCTPAPASCSQCAQFA